jgi:hypothetical protein
VIVLAIIWAIVSGQAINECSELSPWAAREIVRWSARVRYTDPVRARARGEELAALIDAHPGKLFKLITALWFAAAAIRAWTARAMASMALADTRVTGRAAIAADTVTTLLGPPGHQTVSLHDHAFVRADGQVGRVRTVQMIEALRDGLDSIPYIYDLTALTLQVGHGCEAPAGPGSQIKDGPHVLRIPLAKTLSAGETHSLEYATTFDYPGEITAEQRRYRRAVMRRVDNIDLHVEFDPECVPQTIWWAVWDGVDGGIIEQHRVQPDSQNSVHRYLRLAEETVAGFYWEDRPAHQPDPIGRQNPLSAPRMGKSQPRRAPRPPRTGRLWPVNSEGL